MSHVLRALTALAVSAGIGALPTAVTGVKTVSNVTARPAVVAPSAGTTTSSTNPFEGRTWGVYEGNAELAWPPYVHATGTTKDVLGYIALQPKAKWFGAWIPDDQIAEKVDEYIANSQAGDPDALVQMSIFRVKPWENQACKRLPTAAEQASYKLWIDRFAEAVGDTPTAIVLQPDGPFALCAPHHSTLPSHLVAYAAKALSAQPNTSVYIDAGSSDWPDAGRRHGGVDAAVKILVNGGIRYARGFALNGTHYSDTTAEINRATGIANELARRGYPGRKAVINTTSNGHPFRFHDYTGADADKAFVCPSKDTPATVTCASLGIPPTADVDDPRWHLSARTRTRARNHVDAYLWFGRPWLNLQCNKFVVERGLGLVTSSPYYP